MHPDADNHTMIPKLAELAATCAIIFSGFSCFSAHSAQAAEKGLGKNNVMNPSAFIDPISVLDIESTDDYLAVNVQNGSTENANLLNVPLIKQRPELSSGCEVTALAMALQFYDVHVSKIKLAQQLPYDPTQIKRDRNGQIKTWGDPEVGFVGSPYGTGYTINPRPLKQVLDHYRKGGIALYGKDFHVIESYVHQGKPTLVWFTVSHNLPHQRAWKTEKGKTIFAPTPLHCVVVTGISNKYVYFNDSESTSRSGKNVKVSKSKFIQIYNLMGKKALVVN